MTYHLLACISSHGYGHLTMTAPILNLLCNRYNIRLSVRTLLPEPLLRELITADFSLIPESSDFGMVMKNSITVDLESSKKKYANFHESWELNISEEIKKLETINPDIILSNIPYLTLAAAKQLNIPSVAYCSLNWADIYLSYYGSEDVEAQNIVQQMQKAYNAADYFVCPEPSMPMDWAQNRKSIGPVSRIGKNVKSEICKQLNIPLTTKLVLVTPGGVKTAIPIEQWPRSDEIHWIVSWEYESNRSDITSTSSVSFKFVFNDLLSSCDALITKPGYGTVTNTVCNNIPALYVLRGDWAEEEFLVEWWKKKSRILEIDQTQFYSGDVLTSLQQLWNMPDPKTTEPTGIEELISIIADYIPSELKSQTTLSN